tara:strand:- start:9076 stop:10848 length:1773 start_codon:yes stop_codon:yes gene_type:complete
MSLITLKNTGNQEPFNFRNHFRAPLELPPKSSVSLVSAIVYKGEELNVINNETWYAMVGNVATGQPELNPVYQYQLPAGTDVFTPAEIVLEMTSQMNSSMGQCAYMGDVNGSLTSPAPWKLTWQNGSKRVLIEQQQRTGVVEGVTDLAQYPYSFDPLVYTTGIIGNWVNLRRSGLLLPLFDGRTAIGTTYQNPVTGLHNGCIPRNGGHIVFQPQKNAGGTYDRSIYMGLGQTNPQDSSLAHFQNDNDATFGTYYIETFNDGATIKARVMLNEGAPKNSRTIEPAVQEGADITLNPANQYTFCMEWNSPYTMLIKYSTDYDDSVADPFSSATWTDWVDGTTAGDEVNIPTYNDNYAPMVSMDRQGDMKIRGTFSHQAGTWAYQDAGVDDSGISNNGFDCIGGTLASLTTDTLAGTYPNQYLKKEIQILTNTFDTQFTQQLREVWDREISFWYSTKLGKILGFKEAVQILTIVTGSGDLLSSYEGEDDVTNSHILPTIHIQLTNFGIGSKNGVVSNDVKDIAVIPQFNDALNSNTQLFYEAGYENKINLNNLQTININQIDVLVTYDNNTQARILENSSTFIIKFHKGEEGH